MKRIIMIVGVVLGLGAIGLVAAHADDSGYSTWCTDGVGPGTDVPNGVVGLSYEPHPDNVWVCYSTTPNGSSSPEAAGGNLHVWESDGGAGADCRGDRTPQSMVTLDCSAGVTPTDDGNPATAGTSASASFQAGTVGPVALGRTGAEANPATDANLPGDGNTASGGSLGIGTGTCVWVDGGTPNCPTGGVTVLGVTVNETDLVPSVTPQNTSPPPPCTGIDNTCPGVTVRFFQDTNNPTLSVTVADITEPVDLDDDGMCVQVNAVC